MTPSNEDAIYPCSQCGAASDDRHLIADWAYCTACGEAFDREYNAYCLDADKRERAKMTDDYEALLRGVLLDPADDLPRLVLADWLEEREESSECPTCNGIGIGFTRAYIGGSISRDLLLNPATIIASLTEDSIRSDVLTGGVNPCHMCAGKGAVSNGHADRAEFIRTQIEFERTLPVYLPRRAFLNAAQYRLWLANASKWEISCPGSAMGPDTNAIWTRGFVSEIRLSLAAFLAHAKELFESHPIERVVLTDRRAESGLRSGSSVHWICTVMTSSGCLPQPIFSHLAGPVQHHHFTRSPLRWFDSHETANAALSAACVAYGREKAGLPPMPVAVPASVGG